MHLSNKRPYTSLLCQIEGKPFKKRPREALITHTPLACLNEATQREFALIVIQTANRPISSRDQVFELCRCLKTNPLTEKTPIVVSLDKVHREIAYRMKQTGVRFMNISQASEPMNFGRLISAVNQLDARIRTDGILGQLCPFLHYRAIDDQSELITCHACRNRMVLGGRRLHEICESTDHRYCEHYLHSEINYDISQPNSKTAPGNPGLDWVSIGHRHGNVSSEVAGFNE